MNNSGMMQGISAPVLVPFDKVGNINYEEYEKLNNYIVENGVHGIFVCGTTGEFVNLTIEERKQLLISAKRSIGNRAKVMFNITALNLKEVNELIDCAVKESADSLSIISPYYHKYDESALISYFQQISQMTKDIPLYLYNMEAMTRNPITPNILKKVVEICPNIKGIKDSSMDFMKILDYQSVINNQDFEILTGNDAQVLTTLQAGGHGGIFATAGVFPKLSVEIWDMYQNGNIEGARVIQTKILKLRELYREIMPIMTHKKTLEMEGFDMGPARFPFRDLTVDEIKKLENGIKELGLL